VSPGSRDLRSAYGLDTPLRFGDRCVVARDTGVHLMRDYPVAQGVRGTVESPSGYHQRVWVRFDAPIGRWRFWCAILPAVDLAPEPA
jgi:hypothetical protein